MSGATLLFLMEILPVLAAHEVRLLRFGAEQTLENPFKSFQQNASPRPVKEYLGHESDYK